MLRSRQNYETDYDKTCKPALDRIQKSFDAATDRVADGMKKAYSDHVNREEMLRNEKGLRK
jgi:hypothetical protein